ncbi:MAG: BatD family protein [Chitinophagales bacterium]
MRCNCIPVLIILLFLFIHEITLAQPNFTASSPKSVAENQNFNLTFSLGNATGSNLRLPDLNDFVLLGGPNTSSSMQIMNGSVSQSMTYSYILRPKHQGTFKIAKATIDVKGTTIESNELTIQVTAPSAKQQTSPGENGEQAISSADFAKQLKDDVFVKVILSKNSVYKGELVTATYKLYFRQNLNGFNLIKAPSLDGFWSKEVELDQNRKQKVENYNGNQYYALDILKYNLYPQRSGTLQISPVEISTVAQVTIRGKSRDPFRDPFADPFGDIFNMGQVKNIPLTLRTDVTMLSVKELPETGKPKDFSGAVGRFDFETSLSDHEAKTDDPVTYTVKLSGTGNMSLVEAPAIQFPAGFEVYDPKVKEHVTGNESGTSGSKQYDYLLIPRQPGDYKINSQTFSYFNPSEEKYITINAPEYPLKITGEPSKHLNANSLTYNSQQDISILDDDIRYIKTSTQSFENDENSFFASPGFVALYSLPFFAFISLIAVRRRNDNLSADLMGSKRRRALKLSKKRLSQAAKHLSHTDKKNFYDEVSRAFWGYLSDKLNIDPAYLSRDMVAEKLSIRNVKSETIQRLHNLLSTCELSLYSPVGDVSEMKNDYSAAMNLIADLEDEIRS